MQPTGDASQPRPGTTFRAGPPPARPGFADQSPQGGRIVIPGNYDTSPARDAGDPQNKAAGQAAGRPDIQRKPG